MAKKKKAASKRGTHPNSRKNLTAEGRFADVPGAASEAGHKSAAVRKSRAEVEKLLNENLDEALSLLDASMTREQFREIANNGRNQMQRILAREFSDSKTAFDAIGWAFDRVLGRSLQQIRQQTDMSFKPEKPVIVFKDIERAVKKASESHEGDADKESISDAEK